MTWTAAEAQKIADLEKKIADLRADVGDFTVRPDLSHPPIERPNGEYPLAFRQRQIGVAIDAAVALVEDFRKQLAAMNTGSSTAPQGAYPDIGSARPYKFNGVGPFIGATAEDGAAVMYLRSDIANKDPQRIGNRPDSFHDATAPHIAAITLSPDAGFRFFQNLAYVQRPDGTTTEMIPDPSRYGVVWGMDSEGMMSVNIMVPATAPEADGFYHSQRTHKGQLLVVIPDTNGDVTLRLPQGGDLYIEKGNGHMGTNPTGHYETVSRQRVVTEGNYPPVRGGLHG